MLKSIVPIIALLGVQSAPEVAPESPASAESLPASQPLVAAAPAAVATAAPAAASTPGSAVHAGPAVRKLARELGVELPKVTATGRSPTPRNPPTSITT